MGVREKSAVRSRRRRMRIGIPTVVCELLVRSAVKQKVELTSIARFNK